VRLIYNTQYKYIWICGEKCDVFECALPFSNDLRHGSWIDLGSVKCALRDGNAPARGLILSLGVP
jgi:hypothetical protein